MLQITTQRTTTPKAKPDESNLGFGVHYTDHMLIIVSLRPKDLLKFCPPRSKSIQWRND